MVKTLKFLGLAIGLVSAAIAFSGVKSISNPCHLTDVLGGPPICDSYIQWDSSMLTLP
jgi:hypothetical protein